VQLNVYLSAISGVRAKSVNIKRPEIREEGRVMNNNGMEQVVVFNHLVDKYGVNDAPSWDTFRRWRREGIKDGTWIPKVISDFPATMKPDVKTQVSGINDPILHLSIIAAKKSVAQHAMNSSSDAACIRAVLWDVHQQLEPGAAVLAYLRKSLREWVKAYRSSPPQGLVAVADEDPIEAIMNEVDEE